MMVTYNYVVYAQDGSTPLHFAADNGHVEVARLLINHKANVNAVNKVPSSYL